MEEAILIPFTKEALKKLGMSQKDVDDLFDTHEENYVRDISPEGSTAVELNVNLTEIPPMIITVHPNKDND